jgi:hypothetical protein
VRWFRVNTGDVGAARAAWTGVERRRRQPPDWDATIACRSCRADVRLHRNAIERGPDGRMRVTCTLCGAAFAVRIGDPALELARGLERRRAPVGG